MVVAVAYNNRVAYSTLVLHIRILDEYILAIKLLCNNYFHNTFAVLGRNKPKHAFRMA